VTNPDQPTSTIGEREDGLSRYWGEWVSARQSPPTLFAAGGGAFVPINAAERRSFRLTVAQRETPRAMAVTGGCFVAITVLNASVGPPTPWGALVLNGVVAVLLLGGGWLIHAHVTPTWTCPWIAAICALTMVAAGLVQVWLNPDGAAFGYVLIIIVAFAPLTLAWIPATAVVLPMLVGCVVVSRRWPSTAATDWDIASLAAIAIGMSLLWLRLRSIDEAAELTSQVRTLATRDRLTGALNRHGLDERLPLLAGMARRLHEPVLAMFVDIVGLKRINDEKGHLAGDAVIVTVATALMASVRSSDMVARWGGDEFVVLGLGNGPHPEEFRHRLVDRFHASGVEATVGDLDVTVGMAMMSPDTLDIDALISQADSDMYSRRRSQRKS